MGSSTTLAPDGQLLTQALHRVQARLSVKTVSSMVIAPTGQSDAQVPQRVVK